MGGDGSPSARADDGRVHGPGGPVYMGNGVTCDAAHDHCLRDGVWFSVNNIQAGKLYRALPVFEFEKKWWTWRGEPADDPVKLYKTQIAGNAKIAPGTAVIWFSSETSDGKWAESEYEALTSSRWEAGVVEAQRRRGSAVADGRADQGLRCRAARHDPVDHRDTRAMTSSRRTGSSLSIQSTPSSTSRATSRSVDALAASGLPVDEPIGNSVCVPIATPRSCSISTVSSPTSV
jgi:hypothetical protein